MKKTHGLTRINGRKNPIYCIWSDMIARCTNPDHQSFCRYGGRGIDVCKRWRKSFLNFINDLGPRPRGRSGGLAVYSLERKNNSKNYQPSNCEWALRSQQAKNTRVKKAIESFSDKEFISEFHRRFGKITFRPTKRQKS